MLNIHFRILGITTNISATNVKYIENFANKDGIHVVVFRDNYSGNDPIDYYLINTQGTVLRSATISSNGTYPNIVGDNNSIYVVYRESDKIRIKKSTNAGQTWSNKADISIGTNPCSGVDAIYDSYGIHTVWGIGDQSGDYSEINYQRYSTQNESWDSYYNVTNYSNGYGTSPTVSVSPNRVHVGYNDMYFYDGSDPYYAYDANEMSRTKYYTNWQTQQQISNEASKGKVLATSDKLYDFYYDFEGGMGPFHTDLYFKFRNIGSSTWSTATLLEGFSDITVPFSVCVRENGNIHTYTASGAVKERIIVNGSITSTADVSTSGWIVALYSSSVYNDIYLNWSIGSSNYLMLRQFDAAPEVPSDFSASFTGANPVISWAQSKAPDIQNYKIYKCVVNETGWACVATVSAATTSWVDYSVTQPGRFDPVYTIEYKIQAVDKGNNYSDYTNVQSVTGTTNTFWKISTGEDNVSIDTYKLFANYPNPFNPSTHIEFQIPNYSFVSLKVYNSLGQEVSTLVNQHLEKGKYSVDFSANHLPSGLYIYKLETTEFSSVKKMMLTK